MIPRKGTELLGQWAREGRGTQSRDMGRWTMSDNSFPIWPEGLSGVGLGPRDQGWLSPDLGAETSQAHGAPARSR